MQLSVDVVVDSATQVASTPWWGVVGGVVILGLMFVVVRGARDPEGFGRAGSLARRLGVVVLILYAVSFVASFVVSD